MGFFEWLDKKDIESVKEHERQNEIARQKEEVKREFFRNKLREQGYDEWSIKDQEAITFGSKNGGGSATGGVTQVALFRTFGTSNLDQVFNECAPQMMQGIRETKLQTQVLNEKLDENKRYNELAGRYAELQKNYNDLLKQYDNLNKVLQNLTAQPNGR
ncbi:hypothetical protein [Selenomonas ruminantium]|uniref:hypothetical protein n=1 Tax=Selenomonas ruminantium TaxID=971 RepID=UPI0026EDAE32|nr:hypothetical protein [Selenomonas ruminantium]